MGLSEKNTDNVKSRLRRNSWQISTMKQTLIGHILVGKKLQYSAKDPKGMLTP